jgi:AcrR family transcriptional regulator
MYHKSLGANVAVVIEHSRRRSDILDKALDVFIREGFRSTTFTKIASHCSITRTTLYIYFHNKTDIFNACVKQFMKQLESDILSVLDEAKLSFLDRIRKIIFLIVQTLEKNTRLVQVLYDYIALLRKKNGKPEERVRKRTIRIRHFLADLFIDGMKAGEISAVNIKDMDELIYSILESAFLRIAVFGRSSNHELNAAMDMVFSLIKTEVAS